MKYIVDLEALKHCLGLLQSPVRYEGNECVYLNDVVAMIDAFPKDEVKEKPDKIYREV